MSEVADVIKEQVDQEELEEYEDLYPVDYDEDDFDPSESDDDWNPTVESLWY